LRDLLLDVPLPRQDESNDYTDYGIDEGNQQGVGAIHVDKGWDANGIDFELSREEHGVTSILLLAGGCW
jgi:hypothetical protein